MGVPPDLDFEMTANRKKKLSARDLAAGTGLSYTAALRSLDSGQGAGPGEDGPVPLVPPGLIVARHAGRCGYCGRKIFPGAWIAAHREQWGHARCVGGMRPDVRSWLEERAREHPDVEISLRIAAGYEACGDEEGARRCTADAEAATRKLVAPFQRVPPDLEEEEWYPDEDPLLIRASYLLREVARGAVPAAELTGEAGRCLQQLDLGSAADTIRSMAIGGAPDGPATPEAATARRALEILDEASHVRWRGDEDWTHCQELITWAGKLALGRLKPTLTMPDEVWEFHRNKSGGTSCWLEI